MTDCAASAQAVIMELTDFAELSKLMEKFMPRQPTPVYIFSITSMVWNISTGQLGLTA